MIGAALGPTEFERLPAADMPAWMAKAFAGAGREAVLAEPFLSLGARGRGYLVSEPINVAGDALESVVGRADSLGQVFANLVAAAILLDIGPATLALVPFPTGVAPPPIRSRAVPPVPPSRRAALSARILCASAQVHRQDNGAATSRSPNGTTSVLS